MLSCSDVSLRHQRGAFPGGSWDREMGIGWGWVPCPPAAVDLEVLAEPCREFIKWRHARTKASACSTSSSCVLSSCVPVVVLDLAFFWCVGWFCWLVMFLFWSWSSGRKNLCTQNLIVVCSCPNYLSLRFLSRCSLHTSEGISYAAVPIASL